MNIWNYLEDILHDPKSVSKNTAHYLLNLLVLAPIVYTLGVIACCILIAWVLTCFGVLIIILLIADGQIIAPLILSIIDIFLLGCYLKMKINQFKTKNPCKTNKEK